MRWCALWSPHAHNCFGREIEDERGKPITNGLGMTAQDFFFDRVHLRYQLNRECFVKNGCHFELVSVLYSSFTDGCDCV